MNQASFNEDSTVAQQAQTNESSFETLVAKYKERVFRLCLSILDDRFLAEDLSQEVFLKVFENLDRYDPRYKFSTWLFSIAVHASLNAKKRRKTEKEVIAATLQEKKSRAPSGGAGSERLGKLREVVKTLPGKYRAVLTLRFTEELSCKEIATVMGTTPNAVSIAIYKAKKMILEEMIG